MHGQVIRLFAHASAGRCRMARIEWNGTARQASKIGRAATSIDGERLIEQSLRRQRVSHASSSFPSVRAVCAALSIVITSLCVSLRTFEPTNPTAYTAVKVFMIYWGKFIKTQIAWSTSGARWPTERGRRRRCTFNPVRTRVNYTFIHLSAASTCCFSVTC